MTIASKYILVLFGLFLICVGLLMLFKPQKARSILRSAASTNFINYAEITIRTIPAIAMVIFARHSNFPLLFQCLGWFMIATSAVLYFTPRKVHHNYALWCADLLTPNRIRLISPFSMIFGVLMIYVVLN